MPEDVLRTRWVLPSVIPLSCCCNLIRVQFYNDQACNGYGKQSLQSLFQFANYMLGRFGSYLSTVTCSH
jgi:hypothetical protein